MDFLHYEFMQKALFSGLLLSIITGIISFFVVNKNLSFLGVGISHIAFGGLALGVLIGINPLFVALIFSLIASFIIGKLNQKERIKEDASIGILFAFSMALGIVFIYLKEGYSTDLFSFLFGSILTITNLNIIILFVILFLILFFMVFYFKEFIIMIFDPDYGRIMGIKITLFYYILLGLITISIIGTIKIVGTILISGLLVIPGVTGYIIAKDYKSHLLYSILFSFIDIFIGLILSFYFDLPSGATIVISGIIILSLIFILKKIIRFFIYK